ncbi:PH domain-containing protein [Radiobacillus kanasensis]|uniref:PH domain-containing protein n=1 Tax=Radiobacillus kanasensis TaxID=2844358 RepID=UPI001E60C7DD|nr:PH domain-containing protein [Radiobacillus kanasensis]UFT99814.1 PH domain-containing protein [Radiobacillus kanasensis]
MRHRPINNLATEAIQVWRIYAIIPSFVFLCLIITGVVLSRIIFDLPVPMWVFISSFLVWLILSFITILVVPNVNWKRWRYQVFEQEVDIEHGLLIIKRTLIPMIRVQHVDTKQGPILKKFGLATVTISTAATKHEIPALKEEEAYELRDRISVLARVDEDDV